MFQERSDRLVAAEKCFDRRRQVARVALLVDFVTQTEPDLFIEITVFCFFKHGCHVGSDRIRPGIAVVSGVVAVEATKARNETCPRIDRQKDAFKDWVGDSEAIVDSSGGCGPCSSRST